MSGNDGITILDWDSDFFGCRIARVDAAAFNARSAPTLLERARSMSIECLYLLIDAQDSGAARIAEGMGFGLMDVRITRERNAPDSGAEEFPTGIDLCRDEDIPALRAIARESHRDSRFYHDPNFPDERCDALYQAWIEKAYGDPTSAVVVARHEGSAVGYVSCDILRPGMGDLGLVAVASDQAGRGHGSRMLGAALNWLAGRGCSQIRVVTQARNINANRLYEANSFRTVCTENSYHLWLAA